VNLSEETLMAYVDGELDVQTRQQVEIALAADPEAARRVAAQRALRGTLRAAFDPVLEEPVPARLLSLVRTAGTPLTSGKVLPFRAKPAPVPRTPWMQWGSLAASFALGALVWHFASRQYLAGPFTEQHGGIVASGSLARALSEQLASQQEPPAAVQIGVSFRSKSGDYCRTFRLQQSDGAAGLACHEQSGWRIEVLAHPQGAASPQGQYRQAASALPPTVLRAVDDAIAGDPLDAAAEAQARASRWQAKEAPAQSSRARDP
jgi:hypothetical protein